jgi:hypothetical protein
MLNRDEVALQILVAMVNQKGDKVKKVAAAFDFADMFLTESILRDQRQLKRAQGVTNEGK